MVKVEEKITYRPYLKRIVVNNWEFDTIIISSHYEKEHGSYMNDEKILKIVEQLDKRNGFAPKLQGKLPGRVEWQSFFWEPFCYNKKAYRLIWYWELDTPCLWILNCYRRSKFDKKC
ncbi:hypothetical protein [endosymbiont DhMRE of Dentiscutata heterogama]|uniref:hypothetical protein n=1 Tax=endosymbiont DhMRE of Dentiscutata heterogama TaxID=1609546 RepID=UPI002AD4393C|nr:hypothetical protein [endosymbiont DhMRE of Dentiscutata heterogama]